MRNKLDFIIRGGVVKRFHTMHTLHTQNVGEHSFGVAWLVWLLCNEKPTRGMLMAALAHDLAEHTTGDLPAPAKRRMGVSAQFDNEENAQAEAAGFLPILLSDAEKRTLKIADSMDLLLFCIREIALGNSDMNVVYQRGMSYIMEHAPFNEAEQQLIYLIGERYDNARK